MPGFVVLRVRAHRVLLGAALLTVVLTTTVLATLAAFSDAVGDAGLRQALGGRPEGRGSSRAAAPLQVKAQLPSSGRQSADRAVARGAAYARLARATGLGPFDPADLADPGGDRPLPALVSTGVRTRFGTAPMVLQPEFGQLVVEPAVVRRDTPAQPGGDFVVVDARGVQRRHPDTYADPATGPSVAPLAGRSLDPGALRTTLRNNSPTALTTGLTLRSAVRAQFADSPLHQGAERLYAAAAGTGFALLALSLALLQTAPERTRLLTGLRALGLPPAQGRRLLVLEALPQAVLAAAPVPTAPVRLDADPASLVLPSSPTWNTAPPPTAAAPPTGTTR